jgi:hypothetical protein
LKFNFKKVKDIGHNVIFRLDLRTDISHLDRIKRMLLKETIPISFEVPIAFVIVCIVHRGRDDVVS